MKKQRLTKIEKRQLANKAFMSVVHKANSYPAWMKEYFHHDLNAYNIATDLN